MDRYLSPSEILLDTNGLSSRDFLHSEVIAREIEMRKILGVLSATFLASGFPANASIVSYQFESSQSNMFASLAIDQAYLPVYLSGSSLFLRFWGYVNLELARYTSGDQAFEYRTWHEVPTFDPRAIVGATFWECTIHCHMSLSFNSQGEIENFSVDGFGDPDWFWFWNDGSTWGTYHGIGEDGSNQARFNVERTGEVLGATSPAPIPLPASGALLISAFAMLGFGRLARRKRSVV